MIIMFVLSALNSTKEKVRVGTYRTERLVAAPNGTRRSYAPPSDGPWPVVFGKLLATNQAGRICRGSDRGSGLVPSYYPSSCFAYYCFFTERVSHAGITMTIGLAR